MKRGCLALAVFAAMAFASQAGAANFEVFLGEQIPCGFIKCPGVPAVPAGTTLDLYLPGKITIDAGDSVTYSSASFHTVSYGKPVGLFVPDPAKGKYGALADAVKSPFYFVGLPKLIYNGQAFGPYGPTTISGTTPASSGALSPAGPKAKPATFTFTFPKAGSYQLNCTIHPGMKGTVVVKPAGSPLPMTPTQEHAAALQAVNAAWAQAATGAKGITPPGNTVYMGYGKSWTALAFLPETLTVKAGTTVTFVNKAPAEVHNVTFGPKKYILGLQKTTDLLPTGPSAPNQVAPFLIYGSEPKGHYSYDGKNHGNGFLATPLNAGSKAIPLPQSWKVTFTTPGSYSFFCWIHGPQMKGKIVVTK